MADTGFEMAEQKRRHSSSGWACIAPGTVMSSTACVDLVPLIEVLGLSVLSGALTECLLNHITVDSRNVQPGSFFIALSGSRNDGHNYVGEAVDSQCRVVLVDKGRVKPDKYSERNVCVLEATDTRKVLGTLAEIIFAFPAKEMTMLAVTGTNGKTTVTYLLESVLRRAGKQPGVLGTINYRYYTSRGDVRIVESGFTTPEPFLLQERLREMADNDVDTVIMEVSSHGLVQNRIGNLLFEVVAFTNLSRDHLDYHLDMEDYFTAKTLLFTKHLQETGTAIITCGEGEASIWSDRLQHICGEGGYAVVSCGNSSRCDIHPLSVTGDLQQTVIKVKTPEAICSFSSSLVGDFNVMNLQTTFAMAYALGMPSSVVCDALGAANGAPGRLQRIEVCACEQDFRPTVFVDYAHTPDALEQVLKTVSALPHKVLYCVFGCGGDRDRGKRALMGEVAGKYADVVILTDDNPRSENPQEILISIANGVSKTELAERDSVWLSNRKADSRGFVVISDRHQAISSTIAQARAGDIVLVAGKGHEDYQISNTGKTFFDDSHEAAEALNKWTLNALVQATDGELIGTLDSRIQFRAINTDSRTIQPGDVFLALRGERFDAHDYVSQVIDAGAGCLVLSRMSEFALSVPVVLVKNTETALGDLASYRRSCVKEISEPKVVAITGSSGKTTVKEMCAAIFARQWPKHEDAAPERVLKTKGNFNNLIGLPLSLLPVSNKHKAVTLEMGMNRPGEIERLTNIADPDLACVLNVHGAHLQGLGCIEGVAKAKGELFQSCGEDTVLLVNADDSRVVELARQYGNRKIFFGLAQEDSVELDVYATARQTESLEKNIFTLHVKDQNAEVCLSIPGAHNVSNALAAAAITYGAGIDISTIAEGLSSFVSVDRRMQILDGPGGSRIINDTYNANPASMKAGITTLCELGSGSHVAILGDMLELGSASEGLHKNLGAHIAYSKVDFLCVVGDFATETVSSAIEHGMDAECVKICADHDECRNWMLELVAKANIQKGTYILVKGSRMMRLEELVNSLVLKEKQ